MRIPTLLVVACTGLSACQGPEPSPPLRLDSAAPSRTVQTATLVVRTRAAPGDTYYTVTWTEAGRSITAQAYHAYNAPTGDSTWRGNFDPVLAVISDQPASGDCHDLRAVFVAIQAAGWMQSGKDAAKSGGAESIDTYHFRHG